ncbi:MAG: hypothetical protein ABIJ09_18795 [Pseudomonadota bacterium]
MTRSTLLGVLTGVLLGALATAGTLAHAQVPAAPAVSVTTSSPMTPAPPASVAALPPDTVVSIKDHGDSQTVMVYKLDDKGVARLTHKARFFY